MRNAITDMRQAMAALAAILTLLALAGARPGAFLQADAAPPLRLKAASVDTGRQPSLLSLLGDEVLLVQFEGAIRPEWRKAIEATGAIIHDYVPEHAYLVQRGEASVMTLRRCPGVRWVGAYGPRFKVMPHLLAYDVTHRMTIQLLAESDMVATLDELSDAGCQVVESWQDRLASYVIAEVPPDALSRLTEMPAVRWIERYAEPCLDNNVGRSYDVTAVDSTWDDLGMYGAGQIVCVADTGLDNGNAATVHPDFRGRILAGYGWGREGDWSDPNYHGTHVAGSVLGNGVMSDANPAQHDYKYSYAGTAPEARLIIQSGYVDADSGLGGLPAHLASLFDQAYGAGARIHTNSWSMKVSGTDPDDIYGVYSSVAHQVDAYVWDHKDLLILGSVSNDGKDADGNGVVDNDSVKAPSLAKNAVGVGASENYRPDQSQPYGHGSWAEDYPARPVSIDRMADDMHGLAAFSGRGPTDDGRYKPDLVAPGTYIISTQSQVSDNTGWGRVDDYYCYASGTSMATPFTAGAAAVARQYFVEREQEANPSAALLKATLLLGARDISPGQYGHGLCQEIADAYPSFDSGFGLLNLRDSLVPWAPREWAYDDETQGLETDEYVTYEIQVGAPAGASATGRISAATRGKVTPGSPRNALPAGASGADDALTSSDAYLSAGTELVRDGGFEQGLAQWQTQGWVETSSSCYSGSQALYMGAVDETHDYCWQTLTIPGDITDGIVTFWLYQRGTEEVCGLYDYFWAGFYDTLDESTTYSDLEFRDGMAVTDAWIKVTHRLTTEEIEDIRGRQIDLTFEIKTDDYGPTSVRVDEVSFLVACNGARLATGDLRAVLVWSDYPGAVFAEHTLVNDLDLVVIDPQGREYPGNGGVELDGTNNVEVVWLVEPDPGTYRVLVKAYEVAHGPQPYAIAFTWEDQPVIVSTRGYVPLVAK